MAKEARHALTVGSKAVDFFGLREDMQVLEKKLEAGRGARVHRRIGMANNFNNLGQFLRARDRFSSKWEFTPFLPLM